jgi:hypothetical protein
LSSRSPNSRSGSFFSRSFIGEPLATLEKFPLREAAGP